MSNKINLKNAVKEIIRNDEKLKLLYVISNADMGVEVDRKVLNEILEYLTKGIYDEYGSGVGDELYKLKRKGVTMYNLEKLIEFGIINDTEKGDTPIYPVTPSGKKILDKIYFKSPLEFLDNTCDAFKRILYIENINVVFNYKNRRYIFKCEDKTFRKYSRRHNKNLNIIQVDEELTNRGSKEGLIQRVVELYGKGSIKELSGMIYLYLKNCGDPDFGGNGRNIYKE